jgi:hypothetical protein
MEFIDNTDERLSVVDRVGKGGGEEVDGVRTERGGLK